MRYRLGLEEMAMFHLPSYRRIRMVVTPTIQGDIEMGVNVWKSNSPDVLGIWGIAAASALCSH